MNAAQSIALCVVRRRRPHAAAPARCAWTTTTPATPRKSTSASIASSSSRCRGRAIRRGRSTTTNRGKYFFEVVDAATGTVALLARLRSIYGEWETTGEAQKMNRTFSESLRFPRVDKPARSSSRSATPGTCFATSGRSTIDPADKFIVRRRRTAAAGPLIKLHEARRSGDEARSADPRRRLHGGASAAKFERDARRLVRRAVRDVAVQGAASATSTSGDSCPPPAQSGISRPSQRHLSPIAGRRDLRRVRLRALRAHVREQGVSRHRRERAVRSRRDPDEQRDVRRRRHLQPVQHGRGGQRVGAVHLRPRVRPPPRRRSPTSTTRRTSRICRRPIASSRGSRT